MQNITAIKCRVTANIELDCERTAMISVFGEITSTTITTPNIMIYTGPPISPSRVSISALTSRHDVNVTWLSKVNPNINTSFTITITALEQSNFILTEYTTSDSFYVFSRPRIQCEVYRFEVMAINSAGASTPVAITRGLPSLYQVEISLSHSVVRRNDGEITIHIIHEVKELVM